MIVREFHLKFQIGDLILWHFPLQVAVVQVTLPMLLQEGQQPVTADLEGTNHGVLVRSTPWTATTTLTREPGGWCYVMGRYQRHAVALQGSFDDYLGSFSAKSRATLRRKVRRFAALSNGEIHWQCYRSEEEMATFLHLARPLAARTYQATLLGAALPTDEAFTRSCLAAAKEGRAWGFLLFHEEEPVAYLYCPQEDGVLLYHYVGHDASLAAWSPGTVLHYLALQRLFAEPTALWFDFTEGEGEHKRLFATHSFPCANVLHVQGGVGMTLLLWLHRAMDGCSHALGQLLQALGLKARLRRWLRRAGSDQERTAE
ncbi:MAG: GNAT family N-acetyltransferase [Magnetococcales bacterium]|nr:GNAT family N-acetyltransferase [Magnetococcales bacterium]NGZ29305.1 GNAT family N-acetyltransferase [Magnetococcales bacterium]